MGHLQELGPLAIASRLKNLTEKLVRDMVDIYQELGISFEPRWFTFVHLLKSKGAMSITHIARELDQTHPAANQVANALEKRGLVASRRDEKDNRKRIVELKAEGHDLIGRLEPVWSAVEQAVLDLLRDSDPEFLDRVRLIESRLSDRPMKERITDKLREMEDHSSEIIPYRPELAPLFRSLNEEWLTTYFRVEEEDERLLRDPEGVIIASGGSIAFIRIGNEIIGTGALLHLDDTTCELTKMAVAPSYRGRKHGRRLLNHLIDEGKRRKYTRMVLRTSPKLEQAVSLYRSAGFEEAEPMPTMKHKYERCSLYMELTLDTNTLTG